MQARSIAATTLLLLGACGGDSATGNGTDDDSGVDPFRNPDVSRFDDATNDLGDSGLDAPEFDADDAGGDTVTGGCDTSDDCAAGEICVDLLPGPENGFCTIRCVDDSQCPEGFDCIVIGEGETSYEACVDVDFCLDEDGDGFGLGPGCDGRDCNDSDERVNPRQDEVCNAIDDDCDGDVDDNTIESGDDCETGFAGVCGEGRFACVGGLTECVARTEASDEICDGLDNDCDGEVDDQPVDATLWYRDVDTDRFGDDDVTKRACSRPAGYVEEGGDCVDNDRGINPVATEICDGYDNDCDGTIDGEAAIGSGSFWRDGDGDGYGDPETERAGCAEVGWVTNDRDCRDDVFEINPEAADVCDGLDNDCNGTPDDGVDAATRWFRDEDEDGFGDPDVERTGCEEAGWVLDARDCNDEEFEINPDATDVCDGEDNDCNGTVDDGGTREMWYRDFDGDGWGDPDDFVLACDRVDGYVSRALDCDDRNRDVNPTGVEICNGLNDDCDADVDEGVGTVYYRDGDGDGYGDAESPRTACSLPAGYVADATDCDDSTGLRHPFRIEVCDGLDNDCNGIPDDGVGTEWFLDNDGDSWGGTSIWACTQPAGTVGRGGDCNDANGAVNPGAEEYCSTSYDDNCNDAINESSAIDAEWWFLDNDGDGQGESIPIRFAPFAVRACTQPDDFCVFLCIFERIPYVDNEIDCDDTSGRARVGGGPEVCDGYDNDCDGTRDNGFTPRNLYYRDRDGDGYGSTEIEACTEPIDADAGDWVSTCCDRDDDDAGIH